MLNMILPCKGSRAEPTLIGILFIFLVCAQAVPAFASDTLKLIPAVSASEKYDSNVYMMGKGDMEHSLVPSLKLDLQEERYRGWLKGSGTIYKYTKLNEFDRADQSYDAFFEVNATERVVASFNAGQKIDHTFNSALENTGQVAEMVTRHYTTFQPSLSYGVTENNTATIFGMLGKTKYGAKTYTDSTSTALGARWGYNIDERTQAIVQISNTKTSQETAEQTVLSTMGGFEYGVTELIKARVLVGSSSLHSTTSSGKSSSSRGFSTDSSVQWFGEKSQITAGFLRDMTSGLNGEDIVRTRFSFNSSYSFTERMKMLANANTVLSKTSGESTTEQTTRWIEVSPSLQYQTGEYSTVSLGYAFGTQSVKETDVSKRRSQVFLNFAISFP